MKAIVKKEGLIIPKKLFKGIKEAEIRLDKNRITILPIKREDDPIWRLGSNPGHSRLKDGALNHDTYIYDFRMHGGNDGNITGN